MATNHDHYHLQQNSDDEETSLSNTPQKELGNGRRNYTPQGNNRPVVVKVDANGKAHAEVGSSSEREAFLPQVTAIDPDDGEVSRSNGKVHAFELEEPSAPTDKFMLVYLILLVHGIGTLMPWNMFITAESYFTDYKLATNGSDSSEYRKNFISYLGITAQIPNVLLNLINMFFQCGGGGTTVRVVVSISVMVVFFIVTVVLAMIDTSEWPGVFFAVTMGTVVIINMATGVYQNSIYGLAANLPMKYTNAVVLGSNTSGTLTSVISILALAGTPDPRTSAIYYFVAAIIVLLIAFDTFFALPLLKFYRYYHTQGVEALHEEEHKHHRSRPPYWKVFKKVWVQLFNVWFVFFVSLTCFPSIQVNVEMLDENFMNPRYFTPVTCFLFFNAFAMMGNLTTEWIKKPGPKWVWIPIVLRVLFIPFFLMCNYRPEHRSFPVIIGNDYVYCLGGIIMAFTSGYFSSLCMMYAPHQVGPEFAGTAGMMAAFFLVFGIFSGVNFSLFVAWLVEAIHVD
ncbi:equilibrative nucleoside transporter 3 [Lingula anatina]|uniref:Equilibrative nucleoside transporter 3 n=1 Tax=Lingula anatina TaxID=7574 RepID=A0A1S3IEE6_LINAN|nr:equilibrative nucleoside transporter 3 [Lingula anatina]|eukprot:XP_013396630.1 equilibrative nucleoside transporter 3 [Lingula anatina]